MKLRAAVQVSMIAAVAAALTGCNNARTSSFPSDNGGVVGNSPEEIRGDFDGRSSLWDLFGPNNAEQVANVNRYLWAASLDVLNFLPIQSVDPFTGVIVTGYGTPPGGGRAYRATVHIKDPALDARSLSVSLLTKGGPVSPATTRAVEDAILSRARQLRIGDEAL
ncbi:DUF3576 domain-containing protein [Primorskyibacter sp. S87]|uniref:DUF3576 domain-containing protein n=1 Tax=Primorskyibacter sp. S87 TaxID=3415126 RepID=UPI003C7D4C8F